MTKQVVFPLNNFYVSAFYSDKEFNDKEQLIEYIKNLEETVVDEELELKVKDVFEEKTNLDYFYEITETFGYNLVSTGEKKKIEAWLLLMNIFCDKNFTYFEEVDFVLYK